MVDKGTHIPGIYVLFRPTIYLYAPHENLIITRKSFGDYFIVTIEEDVYCNRKFQPKVVTISTEEEFMEYFYWEKT